MIFYGKNAKSSAMAAAAYVEAITGAKVKVTSNPSHVIF